MKRLTAAVLALLLMLSLCGCGTADAPAKTDGQTVSVSWDELVFDRTMPLRYAQHDATARQLAAWLGQQTAVAQVLHPALPSGLGHEHWRALCCTEENPQGRAAGLFSIVLQPHISRAQAQG